MHYMLLFHETSQEIAKRSDATQAEAYWGGWTAYIGAIAQSGVMVSGNGLQTPDVSTTIRVANGKRHIVDGPFADTKEMLGGYVIVDVADLDAALEWASRAPCATAGSIEIRPIMAPACSLMPEARPDPAKEAEVAARSSYGKLLSMLAGRCGDIAAAEDALSEAFAAALTQWPRDGTPDNPVGWLMAVARRGIGHAAGRSRTATAAAETLQLLQAERDQAPTSQFGDQRLALMFVCAHPAINAEAQAPLMLQTVLGLDAARIAACFLVSSANMGQRLVRAKRKIFAARIPFIVPEPSEAPARVSGVLSAIYAAYGTAWEDVGGADSKLNGLASEAVWLARLLNRLLPADPEVMGLLSLMLHCEARRMARRDVDGGFVPLSRQDTSRWSRPMIAEAEGLIRSAARAAAPGRFQMEAAIQSLHAHQRMTDGRFAEPLARLYDSLAVFAPTTGVLVARAVAYAENGDPAAGLSQLDEIENAAGYQPWWAAKARACWLAGDSSGAWEAARTAAGLSSDPSVRNFLLEGGFRSVA